MNEHNAWIRILAGKQAYETLKVNGFSPDLFSTLQLASGGPKYLSIFALDKYLATDFFSDKEASLNLYGSSSGAFRAACFAQNNPIDAMHRFTDNYVASRYSNKPTSREVSTTVRRLISCLLGTNGATEITENPVRKLHFTVSKCKGLMNFQNTFMKYISIGACFAENLVARKRISRYFNRYVFHAVQSNLNVYDPHDIPTTHVPLTKNNTPEALLASGTIPFLMDTVNDITEEHKGQFLDGGLVDYHFDLQFTSQKLTLFPHFHDTPLASWFDKRSGRKISKESLNNKVIICPSNEFIKGLPHNKIPEKSDFTSMDYQMRVRYWNQVIDQSNLIAESLDELLNKRDIEQYIELIQ